MKRIAVLTSGGDAPGMNAAIRSVVRNAIFQGIEVYGIYRGYQGLVDGEFVKMHTKSVSDILQRGGTILKTARSSEFMTLDGLNKSIENLKLHNIDALVTIGGDGTFKGAKTLSEKGINVIGIPSTIDNDLAYTDDTIGFLTALDTVVDAVSKLRDTSSSHERVNIVEVMGRSCGDIALYSGVAGGAEESVIPEIPVLFEDVAKRVNKAFEDKKSHCLIIFAEGAGDIENLKKIIENNTGRETRISKLGYIQRGGSPVAMDRILASRLGEKAIKLIIEKKFGQVVGNHGNEIINMDISKALEIKRKVNIELYNQIFALSI